MKGNILPTVFVRANGYSVGCAITKDIGVCLFIIDWFGVQSDIENRVLSSKKWKLGSVMEKINLLSANTIGMILELKRDLTPDKRGWAECPNTGGNQWGQLPIPRDIMTLIERNVRFHSSVLVS